MSSKTTRFEESIWAKNSGYSFLLGVKWPLKRFGVSMSLSPRLTLKQSLQLAMTPKLQQAIKLLQMTGVELAEFLESELGRNPFLEAVALKSGSDNRLPSANLLSRKSNIQSGFDLSFAEQISAPISLPEHLLAQIGVMKFSKQITDVAKNLIYELDDAGYLRQPLEDLVARTGYSWALLEAGIKAIQSCSPTGVGARNLAECLRIQLTESGRFDETFRLILDNITLVASNQLSELARKTRRSESEISEYLAILLTFNPNPGHLISTDQVATRIPDILVSPAENGGWNVELTPSAMPRVMVNNSYTAHLKTGDAAANKTLVELSNQAQWLERTLNQRANTILKVASAIVLRQQAFCGAGIAEIRPMSLKDVASDTGLHESSVSRAVAGKYLLCDAGIFPLKFLFSQAIPAMDGKASISATYVRYRIGQIVGSETNGPKLTDAEIESALLQTGVRISRRTVAKYRDLLRIPTASKRQKRKAMN